MTGLLRVANVVVGLTLSGLAVAPTHAILGTRPGRPASDFSGTWQLTNPKADVLFAAHVSAIPSDGRLIIVQDASQIKLTWRLPPGNAHPSEPLERSYSYRIAPDAAMGAASWKGTSLLIQHPDGESPNWKNVTSALTLVGGDLQIDKAWELRDKGVHAPAADTARRGALTFTYRRTPAVPSAAKD